MHRLKAALKGQNLMVRSFVWSTIQEDSVSNDMIITKAANAHI